MIYQKATDNFVESEVDGELVLLHLDTGRFHALKDTGLDIWRLLDGKRDMDAVQTVLMEQYDVEAATCESDITAFIQSMVQAGFVEKV